MREVMLPKYECLRCGHVWHPRLPRKPSRCGRCKNPYWDRPRIYLGKGRRS